MRSHACERKNNLHGGNASPAVAFTHADWTRRARNKVSCKVAQ